MGVPIHEKNIVRKSHPTVPLIVYLEQLLLQPNKFWDQCYQWKNGYCSNAYMVLVMAVVMIILMVLFLVVAKIILMVLVMIVAKLWF